MFSLFNFSSIFPWGSADPICPYVRTPMIMEGVKGPRGRKGFEPYAEISLLYNILCCDADGVPSTTDVVHVLCG